VALAGEQGYFRDKFENTFDAAEEAAGGAVLAYSLR